MNNISSYLIGNLININSLLQQKGMIKNHCLDLSFTGVIYQTIIGMRRADKIIQPLGNFTFDEINHCIFKKYNQYSSYARRLTDITSIDLCGHFFNSDDDKSVLLFFFRNVPLPHHKMDVFIGIEKNTTFDNLLFQDNLQHEVSNINPLITLHFSYDGNDEENTLSSRQTAGKRKRKRKRKGINKTKRNKSKKHLQNQKYFSRRTRRCNKIIKKIRRR